MLGLCADAGLVSVGVVAVDGSKFAAAAADRAIRSYDQIAAEIIEQAGQVDAAENDIHGPARGDELPEHLTSREGGRAWLREAKQRLERERAERAEPVPRGRQQMGSGPRPHSPPARPEGKLTLTDPDARSMKQGRAFMPAYNAQAVTTEQQIGIAAELTTEGVDFEQLEHIAGSIGEDS